MHIRKLMSLMVLAACGVDQSVTDLGDPDGEILSAASSGTAGFENLYETSSTATLSQFPSAASFYAVPQMATDQDFRSNLTCHASVAPNDNTSALFETVDIVSARAGRFLNSQQINDVLADWQMQGFPQYVTMVACEYRTRPLAKIQRRHGLRRGDRISIDIDGGYRALLQINSDQGQANQPVRVTVLSGSSTHYAKIFGNHTLVVNHRKRSEPRVRYVARTQGLYAIGAPITQLSSLFDNAASFYQAVGDIDFDKKVDDLLPLAALSDGRLPRCVYDLQAKEIRCRVRHDGIGAERELRKARIRIWRAQ